MTVLLYILCVIQSTNDRDIYIYICMYTYPGRGTDSRMLKYGVYIHTSSRVQLVWYVDMNAPPKKSTASYVYCNTVHIDTTGTEVQQSVSQSVNNEM